MRHQKTRLLVLLWLLALPAWAAHTRARLLLGAQTARPGDSFLAGIELAMEPGWHTYWRNSGASGMPTEITWELPPGITAGPVQWPLGEKQPESDLTTYVYTGKVVLLVPLQVAKDAAPGLTLLKAKVSWLECEKLCIPGGANLEAKLWVGEPGKASADSEFLAQWMRKVPSPEPKANAQATWEGKETEGRRTLRIEWQAQAASKPDQADFYPYSSTNFEVLPDTTFSMSSGGKVRVEKAVRKLSGPWPGQMEGVAVEVVGGKRTGFEVALRPGGTSVSQPARQPLWLMLIYAFVGGLILNIMPCVLPVISLKILGFVRSAGESPRRVRNLGIIYAAGVLFSFLVLAGIVIGVKAAGQSAGWGMQFGNPQFIVALGTLITLVALNLFGLFEVNLGSRVLNSAGAAASRHGTAGAFFNGVLATILATPCTAPFLGAALGFAFLQPAPYIILIFCVVAVGLAFPYVVLSWNPRLLRFLPKPGAWMERFKVAMGFPMLATGLWLASLLTVHYGQRAWWFGIFLATVALAAWIYGEFVQRGTRRKGLAGIIVLLVLAAGYWLVLEQQLQWRSPVGNTGNERPLATADGIPWEKWSADAVEAARRQNRPVLVDFTADWCLTCQANKKFALEVPDVRKKLQTVHAVALLGDYTRLPANITQELNRYGRAGVPLVLVFPADATRPAIVLPEALTPGIVLDALDRATRS